MAHTLEPSEVDEVAAETFSALWPPGFPEGHCRLCSAQLKGIQETQLFWKLLLTSSAFWMLPAAAEPTSRGPLSPGGLRLCSLLAIPQVVTSSAPQTPPGLPGILPVELLTSREGGVLLGLLEFQIRKGLLPSLGSCII